MTTSAQVFGSFHFEPEPLPSPETFAAACMTILRRTAADAPPDTAATTLRLTVGDSPIMIAIVYSPRLAAEIELLIARGRP